MNRATQLNGSLHLPSTASLLARTPSLGRVLSGLIATGLFEELVDGAQAVVLAPVDEAFDALPWSFDELLGSSALAEQRCDVFEYLLLRGVAPHATGALATVQGERVLTRQDRVWGRFGSANVVERLEARDGGVVVLDACPLAVHPASYDPCTNPNPLRSTWRIG